MYTTYIRNIRKDFKKKCLPLTKYSSIISWFSNKRLPNIISEWDLHSFTLIKSSNYP